MVLWIHIVPTLSRSVVPESDSTELALALPLAVSVVGAGQSATQRVALCSLSSEFAQRSMPELLETVLVEFAFATPSAETF